MRGGNATIGLIASSRRNREKNRPHQSDVNNQSQKVAILVVNAMGPHYRGQKPKVSNFKLAMQWVFHKRKSACENNSLNKFYDHAMYNCTLYMLPRSIP